MRCRRASKHSKKIKQSEKKGNFMSQRNPLNDRYQQEGRKGTTRKSAASAKPKAKAAESVHIQTAGKTKEQKKVDKKAAREKAREEERNFYNPPTPEYKRYRKIWWVTLIAAMVLTVLSFVGQHFNFPQEVVYVTLGLAYVFIIVALYVDFAKCRKLRKEYAALQSSKKKKQKAEEGK